MTEEFIHFIWFHKFFSEFQETILEEKINIIDVGLPNTHAGPDVFNAKIKRGNTTWAGNIEFHIKASDWNKHGHSNDEHFNSVILHVVLINDTYVVNQKGEKVPQLVLKYPSYILKRYQDMQKSKDFIACTSHFREVDTFKIDLFLNRLVIERLQRKTDDILARLKQNKGDWLETYYTTLGRNFGFSTNALPFELLTQSVSIYTLSKHKDHLLQIEALLFGQAHLLPKSPKDRYTQKLKKEYQFLAHKYQLHPIDNQLWRFLRLRPSNFPTLKIAQFAQLLVNSKHSIASLIGTTDSKDWYRILECEPSSYWSTHYRFDIESKFQTKSLSCASKQIILINTIVPFLFAYGRYHQQSSLEDRAIEFLENLPAENNYITRGFEYLDYNIKSALQSQALIQLKTEYCDKRDCLRCHIGHEIYKIKI